MCVPHGTPFTHCCNYRDCKCHHCQPDLVCAGLTHLITMDLHQKEIQGFFNIPVDNLRASPFLLQYIQEEVTTFDLYIGPPNLYTYAII